MGPKKINQCDVVAVEQPTRKTKKPRAAFLLNACKLLVNKFFKTDAEEDSACDHAVEAAQSTSANCHFEAMPVEMLLQVFKHLDKSGLLNARAVCSDWNAVDTRYMQKAYPIMPVSRMTITYVQERAAYKFSWCNYSTGDGNKQMKCHELFVTKDDIKAGSSFGFCFAQLDIQRLMIESMSNGVLNDAFVRFLCEQLGFCQEFRPVQLSIKNVDLGKLSSDTLKNLLVICSKRLEILEFFAIDNVAPDLITDDHLLLLEHNRVRRLSIQFKDSAEDAHIDRLEVGDASLQAFAKLRMFPSFVMGRCVVTASAVCDYVREWLVFAEQEEGMKSHSLTLSDCPFVSAESFEEECRRRGLTVIERTADCVNKFPFELAENGTHHQYAIRLNHDQQEFVVHLLTISSEQTEEEDVSRLAAEIGLELANHAAYARELEQPNENPSTPSAASLSDPRAGQQALVSNVDDDTSTNGNELRLRSRRVPHSQRSINAAAPEPQALTTPTTVIVGAAPTESPVTSLSSGSSTLLASGERPAGVSSAEARAATKRRAQEAGASTADLSGNSLPGPSTKIRRMHVGGNPHLAPNTTRSVADRIKGITLSEHLAAAYDNNLPLDGPVLNEETNRENNQTRASTSQFGTAEQCRARPKPTAAANLVANKRNMVAPSITLDERQRNTVRIIGQYLTSLGLKNTAEQLVEETGCRIENPLAVRLRNHIRQRSWARAIEVLDRMRDVLGPENYNRTRVLLVEERIKEKLAAKDTIGVLKLLRNEYPTAEEFRERREFLTTRLFRDAGDTAALFEKRDTEKVVDETLKYLYKLMPSTVLLAPDRLERLINHAWNYQLERCDLHVNEADTKTQGSEFVLKDHSCSTEDFPSHCAQVLRDHKTEVWCVKFSPCGKMLATGAKDSKIIVWKVEDEKPLRLSKYRRLRLPQNVAGVAVLSWSSDSRLLAVATSERTQRGVFIFNISAGDQLSEIRSTQNENFNAVAFFADNSHRFACADHNGNFQYHDVDNPTVAPKSFHGFRIRCLYSKKDGHTVIAADNLNRIRSYDFDTQEEITLIHENSHITYFSVDPTEEFCLVTTKNEGLRLWSLTTRTLVRTYFGSVHNDFVITSTFGGAAGDFIASGSEDDQVIIWNRRSDKPVHRIQGHTGSVNSVSWNPVQHRMLASASDDGTVRIWVPAGDVSTS